MNLKGVFSFLAATYLVTAAILYAVSFGWLPYSIYTCLGVLFVISLVPAFAAMLAARLDALDDAPAPCLCSFPLRAVIVISIAVPIVFAAFFAVQAGLGLVQPDWKATTLLSRLPTAEEVGLSPAVLPLASQALLFLISLALGPFFALYCLGSEYGWRAYLMERLLPLGRFKAYLIAGVTWGGWLTLVALGTSRHAAFKPFATIENLPGLLMAFGPGPRPVLVGVALVLTATAFGAILGVLWKRYANLWVPAVCAGCFLAQATGMWHYLFPFQKLPWSGPFGLVALVFWTFLAVVLHSWFREEEGIEEPSKP